MVSLSLLAAACVVTCAMAQTSQDAGTQKTTPNEFGAFQRLPPLPTHGRLAPTPTKMPVAPTKAIDSRAQVFQPRTCAIPLLSATPDSDVHYSIQTINPPAGQVAARDYVTSAPTCGDAGQGFNYTVGVDGAIKK
jgi:hypothetical protein